MTWRFHYAIVHVWLGCVIHEIVGEEFFENSEVPFACTSSVFRLTTVLAASGAVILPIVLVVEQKKAEKAEQNPEHRAEYSEPEWNVPA
jgi:hypothetical protein